MTKKNTNLPIVEIKQRYNILLNGHYLQHTFVLFPVCRTLHTSCVQYILLVLAYAQTLPQ
jgi:hypothetical protein